MAPLRVAYERKARELRSEGRRGGREVAGELLASRDAGRSEVIFGRRKYTGSAERREGEQEHQRALEQLASIDSDLLDLYEAMLSELNLS